MEAVMIAHLRMLGLLLFAAAACGSSHGNCDSALLPVTCRNPNGQCVEFTALSTHDSQSAQAGCVSRGGATIAGSCPTSGRLGSCTIPPDGPGTDVTCSPHATITIRYFAPFTAGDAQSACAGVSGAVWTPN
jgi:hypothetical protein